MSAGCSSAWRSISDLPDIKDWNGQKENELRRRCKNVLLQDLGALAPQRVKILMFGATQNGKSSLVNSLLAGVTSQMNQYALPGGADFSFTRGLHSSRVEVDEEPSNVMLTDIPGIYAGQGQNDRDYIKAVLKGHIREDMEVPEGPIDQDADYYIKEPEPFDRPCCVVLVLKAGVILNDDVRAKYQLVIDEARTTGLKVAVVLTHVDNMGSEWDRLTLADKVKHYALSPWYHWKGHWPSTWSSGPVKGKEVRRMFHSGMVQEAVKLASKVTGIQTRFIHPVVNYTDEEETSTEMNILHLHTLSRILELASLGAKDRLRLSL